MNFDKNNIETSIICLTECFEINNENRLKEIYSTFHKNFYLEGESPKVYDGIILRREFLLRDFNDDLLFDNSYWLGVDLPILLTENKNSKLAILISEDPFRNENDKHLIPHKNDIILSTPFGLHLCNINNRNGKASHNLFLNFIITPLLENGYNVYSTDVFKLWMKKEGKSSKFDFTNNSAVYTNFLNCLEKEIFYLKEKYSAQEVKFITVGKRADDSFKKIKQFDKPNKIHHPAAWNEHFKIKTGSEILKVSKAKYYQEKLREIINQ